MTETLATPVQPERVLSGAAITPRALCSSVYKGRGVV